MEAVRTSETSVNYFTRQYTPEDNSEHIILAAVRT
jgi:hypothetical protein